MHTVCYSKRGDECWDQGLPALCLLPENSNALAHLGFIFWSDNIFLGAEFHFTQVDGLVATVNNKVNLSALPAFFNIWSRDISPCGCTCRDAVDAQYVSLHHDILGSHGAKSSTENIYWARFGCSMPSRFYLNHRDKEGKSFMLYRVGRKRRRTQSLHMADIMRSPLRALNAKGIQTFKDMKSLNLLNSVVQNYLRMLSK